MNDPATANYYKDSGYVVQNNKTGDIVQVSDVKDPKWKERPGMITTIIITMGAIILVKRD